MLEPTERFIKEVCREYREAKDKKAQVKILAELNGMKPYEMLQLLKDAGEDVDMRWYLAPERKKKIGDTMKRVRATEDGPPSDGQSQPEPTATRESWRDPPMEAVRSMAEQMQVNLEILRRQNEELRAERDELRMILTSLAEAVHRIVEEATAE